MALFQGLVDVTCAPCIQRELWGWSVLSIGALAIAGVFALLLALSRIPGVQDVFPWPLDFFDKGLVIHVIFSFVVWFLGVFCAMLHLAAHDVADGDPKYKFMGRLAGMSVAASFFLLFVPAFMNRGEASLNNYVPVITDRLYYGGLVVLAVGVGFAVLRLLLNLPRRTKPLSPLGFGMTAAGVVYLVAMIDFGLALGGLEGLDPTHAFNEDLFWGGGHVLQFLNVILLVTAWYILGGIGLERSPLSARAMKVAVALLMVCALPTPLVYFLTDDFTAAQRPIFTNLQYALAPPTLIAGIAAVAGIKRWRAEGKALPWRDLAFVCLVLSPVVFGIGGFLGLFVDGADTRTPAHYHGVIAGINVAFMGLFFMLFVPLQNPKIAVRRSAFVQVWMFAVGQTIASIGLFLAGGYGAPRKTAGAEQGLVEMGAKVGMYMNGVGALIAVIGGIMFIWTMGKTLLKMPYANR